MNNLIDYFQITCISGNGGSGAIHFRKEIFIGGPDGGNGGNGGNIIIKGNKKIKTLFNFQRYYHAQNGFPGGNNRLNGKVGKDTIIEVPLGTIIKDKKKNTIIGDIIKEKQEIILLKGGKGGLGNWNFRNSRNKTPIYAQPGLPGSKLSIILELKLLADIGIIGFPNSGKSTLLSVLTEATPNISNYQFTTKKPNLGIINYYKENQSFIIADIPGIIKGASKGKGLGYYFIKHIERISVILVLISSNTKNIKKKYEILLHELNYYNSNLLKKNRFLLLSKSDRLQNKNLPKNLSYILISSHTREGLLYLKKIIWNLLHNK
jgi:GTPase